jgi:hypothetical protein
MFGQSWNEAVTDCVTETGVATLRCIPAVMGNVITFALIASGVVALFFVILAGAKLVTSGGDQKKVDSARKTLTWAIIGLVIILLAIFLVNFIGVITGTGECVNTAIGFGKTECQ